MENWKEIALDDLRQYEDNEDLDFGRYGDTDVSFIAEDSSGDEYIVFEDEDSAEEHAIERVKEDLEENPEYFNQDFLMEHIDAEDFFQGIYDEYNYVYATDIQSESGDTYANRLIDEMVEWDIMDIEEAESDDAEEIAEDRIDDFVSALTSDQISVGNGGYDYYEDNFGKEEAMRLVMQNNLIDIDSASEEAVRIDGTAHFISTYDGNQIDLDNEAVAYRIN
jgi:phage pi2 protein 07